MEETAPQLIQDLQIISALLTAMGADLFGGEPQLLDARSMADFVDAQPFAEGLPYFSANRPLIIGRIESAEIAAKVKTALNQWFNPNHPIRLFRDAAPQEGIAVLSVELQQLGQVPIERPTYAMILPVESLADSRSPLGLHALTAILRSPNGCPWDREQTHASIRSAVIEEAYEVAEAIDDGDAQQLAEELGDLALQVALHAQIALEAGEFTPADVYGHINRKLVRRHPHVFSDVNAETPGAVIATWESVKSQERTDAGKLEKPADPFDRLPRSMPVLARIASVLEGQLQTVSSNSLETDAIGDQLLDLVERVIAGGSNPEAVLERAYRRRTAAHSANS